MRHSGDAWDHPDLPPPEPKAARQPWRPPGAPKPEDHKDGLSEATIMLVLATLFLIVLAWALLSRQPSAPPADVGPPVPAPAPVQPERPAEPAAALPAPAPTASPTPTAPRPAPPPPPPAKEPVPESEKPLPPGVSFGGGLGVNNAPPEKGP
jgi:hypothetical protein